MNNSSRPFAVVTGASNGIGLELAKQFAKNGFDLLIVAAGEGIDRAKETLEGLGAGVETARFDLATSEGVHGFYHQLTAAGRPVDAICFNAGVGLGGDFVRETDLEKELNIINLNCVSTVHLAKHVLRDMVSRGSGRALFTASIAATMPTPFEAVYGASKAFVLSFAESLRNELKDTGVTVTALLPGPTETNFFHRAEMDDTKVGSDKKDSPEDVARQGFEALMAGKEKVVAGSVKTKLMGMANEVLPEGLKAGVHRGMSEPGSAK